jgi:hypothetical protein
MSIPALARFLSIVCALLVAACGSRAAVSSISTAAAPPAESDAGLDLADVAHLFPSIEELEADDELNPRRQRLASELRAQVEQLYVQAGAELRLVARDRAAAQQRVAHERIERGEGTVYVPGATALDVAGRGAVVLASAADRPTMLVRVLPEDTPEFQAWSDMERAIGDELRSKLRGVFRANASTAEPSPAAQANR